MSSGESLAINAPSGLGIADGTPSPLETQLFFGDPVVGEPLVCAIMLTRDRPAMAARAVRCFREQTYPNKFLLAYNSGKDPFLSEFRDDSRRNEYFAHGVDGDSIGKLRNSANSLSECDVLIHWDDDDWSHPNRIAEQVALLQSSGKECTAYSPCLFWDTETREAWSWQSNHPHKGHGASLAYTRALWERLRFKDTSYGEDTDFMRRYEKAVVTFGMNALLESRIICAIHPGNATPKIDRKQREWQRQPDFDAWCRERMAL